MDAVASARTSRSRAPRQVARVRRARRVRAQRVRRSSPARPRPRRSARHPRRRDVDPIRRLFRDVEFALSHDRCRGRVATARAGKVTFIRSRHPPTTMSLPSRCGSSAALRACSNVATTAMTTHPTPSTRHAPRHYSCPCRRTRRTRARARPSRPRPAAARPSSMDFRSTPTPRSTLLTGPGSSASLATSCGPSSPPTASPFAPTVASSTSSKARSIRSHVVGHGRPHVVSSPRNPPSAPSRSHHEVPRDFRFCPSTPSSGRTHTRRGRTNHRAHRDHVGAPTRLGGTPAQGLGSRRHHLPTVRRPPPRARLAVPSRGHRADPRPPGHRLRDPAARTRSRTARPARPVVVVTVDLSWP